MKEPTFNGRKLLPLSVMDAAHAGDAMAMEQVLRYYAGYINKLCTRCTTATASLMCAWTSI